MIEIVKMASGRTWHNLKEKQAERIKLYLLKKGGEEEEVKNPNERWRIRLFNSTFTYYPNGTLYSSPPHSSENDILTVYQAIEKIAGPRYELPDREFLLGFDETGKGEIIGPIVLTGVLFPAALFSKVDAIVGLANTKKRHNLNYWERTFTQLSLLKEEGFSYIVEEIPPDQLSGNNLNRLLDKGYKKIINLFLKGILKERGNLARYRLVLDDYGVGGKFQQFLQSLQRKEGKVIITPNADEKYLEVKVASIIAKRFREKIIKRIKENPKYQIGGLTIGSGNSADKTTKEWLKKWWETYKNFPWFVKKSFKPVKGMGG
ncbi:MAG: hypothetical protein ABIK99_04485 [candidate division WOR-3 bacterium]